MKHSFRLIVMIALLAVPACSSSGSKDASGGGAPLDIKLYSKSTDSRYTYFEVTKKGEMSFAGGQSAITRTGTPMGQITAEERQKLWDIINRHGLTKAKGSFLPPKYTKAKYELSINGHSFHCADDQVPGVAELHDALFDMQANRRYQWHKVQSESAAPKPK